MIPDKDRKECEAIVDAMESDTPETDAKFEEVRCFQPWKAEGHLYDLARRLEWERDEAREEAEKWRNHHCPVPQSDLYLPWEKGGEDE